MAEHIIKDSGKVTSYIDQVRSLADRNRTALGFLPASAYTEAAMKGSLWVALDGNTGNFRGYLLFGGVHPQLKVFQICVHPNYRSSGTAQELIDSLKKYGEDHDYQTISAKVASELEANRFWRNSGFHIIRQVPGRTHGRTINIYIIELDVPSLLHTSRDRDSSARPSPLLGQSIRPLLETPSCVSDLNVFFDVMRNRDDGEAAHIFSAALNNQIRLFVTSEFANELERRSCDKDDDPVLEFAKKLPTLPSPKPENVNPIIEKLRIILSQGTPKTGKRLANDESDLIHLASCIHHQAYGFVTRDSAILKCATDLHVQYGLRILSPIDLRESLEIENIEPSSIRVTTGESEISVSAINDKERSDVERFLNDSGIGSDDIAQFFTPGTIQNPPIRLVMRSATDIIGISSWSAMPGAGKEAIVSLYVNENHPDSNRMIDYILEYSMNLGGEGELSRFDLKIGRGQIGTREIALKRGFSLQGRQGGGNYSVLSKVSFKGMVTKDNWLGFKRDFAEKTNIELPDKMPGYGELMNTGFVLNSRESLLRKTISLFDFETAISPGMVICPGRDAVMVPIEEKYASELLPPTQRQGLLFPQREAAFRLERAYFSGARKGSLPTRGMIVVFYISGERKEAVVAARVTFSDTLTKTQAVLNLSRQGVLTEEEIHQRGNKKDEVAVFTFDNLVSFPRSIDFRELKRMRCVGKANLITMQKLSHESLRRIIDRAFMEKIR